MSDGVENVQGKKVLVRFEGKKCIHSRGCVLSRPDVFVPNVEGEWIHPDAATPEEIAELAHGCPSGAIRYVRVDGGEGEQPPKVNLVRVRENGPLAVHAELRLAGHEDAGTRLTLCRCGLSKNKPFCDSSHVGAFVASGEAPAQESKPLAIRDGELTVTPAKNGPLLLAGNVEIVTGTGHTVTRVTKAALCRCGQSANKPFCDGTHSKVGFVSELVRSMSEPVDLVVIGAGSGGLAASRRAAELGAKVVVIEPGRVGGTCVHRGCVPKKLLVYGAGYAEAMTDAAGFGWTVGRAELDWTALIARKDAELARLEDVYRQNLARAGVRLIEGRACFVDANTVSVGDQRITGRYFLIATGGSPVRPDIEGAALGIVSDDALSLPRVPKRLVVIGGGYVAAELSGLFRALGTEVTVVMRDEAFLGGFDHDVRAWLTEGMRKRGIDVRTGRHPLRLALAERDDGVETHLDDGTRLVADHVLFATGRAPNVTGLGLDLAGVATAQGLGHPTIAVDEASRTSALHVFAVGDVTARVALTPVAIAEGRAVAATLFGEARRFDHRLVPTAVFSRPEVARIGPTEAEARTQHAEIDVYTSSFRPLRHVLSGRDTRTSIKLIVDVATDRVLALHVVGDDAAEIVGGFAAAVGAGVTKTELDELVGIHPTASEELFTLRSPRRVRRDG